MDLNNLEKNTIIQLREFGRELGVKSVTRHRKQQLIELIKEKLQEMAAQQEEQHRLKESGKVSAKEPVKEVKDASQDTEEAEEGETARTLDTEAEEGDQKVKEADTPKPASRGNVKRFPTLFVNPELLIEWLREGH